MAKKLDEKSKAALASLKAYKEGKGQDPNWEAGTYGTFEHFVFREAKRASLEVPGKLLTDVARAVYELHGREQGMSAQANDLAHQQWTANFLAETIRLTLQDKHRARNPSRPVSRQMLIAEVQSLVVVLEENLKFVDARRNERPAFDLDLSADPNFLQQVRRLNDSLKTIGTALAKQGTLTEPRLPEQALREFVLKLCGAAGEGVGKTIAWTTRVFLAWLVIHLLQSAGHPIDSFIGLIQKNLPE